MKRSRRNGMRLNNREGAAAVEFAIVLPILLMIVFGMIEFSVALYDKAVITNASREGARRGIVFDYDIATQSEVPPSDAEIQSVINTYLSDYLISFGGGSSATVTISSTGVSSGDFLTVNVSYPYNYLVLPNFISAITGPLNLNATTIMRRE